ncbi:ABC transporter ATP-binding protein [Rhizobiales bacterium TNE-4]|nr:ABC transporter ATP-binding protein [Rhizobiales bacterium TNE-4]MBV1827567.1 ABC transporter ATP-binding protein [Rhizobiales bacterium TNE-4]
MISIKAKNVTLEYPVFGMTQQSIKKRVLNVATGGLISNSAGIPIVRALRDLSFELKSGDRLGLVGHNGAGKSSLLRTIAGIYPPTSGQLTVHGRIVTTLNIAVGLEPEATGFENIIMRGILFGLSRAEIEARIDDIAEFTELGDYLNMPVRVYSSGMMTRLAFGVVTSLNADILLMDEVIGTGDANFIRKAEVRLTNFMNRAKVLIIASHNEDIIQKLCNKAMLLSHGELRAIGTVSDIFLQYENER